jgi:hypothetical protein
MGRNIPPTHGRHKMPAINKQIFNPRICISFQITFPKNNPQRGSTPYIWLLN